MLNTLARAQNESLIHFERWVFGDRIDDLVKTCGCWRMGKKRAVFAEISAEISGRKNCKVAIICSGRLRCASLPAQKSLSSGRRSCPCGLLLEGLRPLQASRSCCASAAALLNGGEQCCWGRRSLGTARDGCKACSRPMCQQVRRLSKVYLILKYAARMRFWAVPMPFSYMWATSSLASSTSFWAALSSHSKALS